MIKVLERLGIQGIYLNIIKAVYHNPIANINLNGEKLKAIQLKSQTRQVCQLSPHLLNIVFQVLARAIRQLKWIKGYKLERKKSSYLYWLMIWYYSYYLKF